MIKLTFRTPKSRFSIKTHLIVYYALTRNQERLETRPAAHLLYQNAPSEVAEE